MYSGGKGEGHPFTQKHPEIPYLQNCDEWRISRVKNNIPVTDILASVVVS